MLISHMTLYNFLISFCFIVFMSLFNRRDSIRHAFFQSMPAFNAFNAGIDSSPIMWKLEYEPR